MSLRGNNHIAKCRAPTPRDDRDDQVQRLSDIHGGCDGGGWPEIRRTAPTAPSSPSASAIA